MLFQSLNVCVDVVLSDACPVVPNALLCHTVHHSLDSFFPFLASFLLLFMPLFACLSPPLCLRAPVFLSCLSSVLSSGLS